MDESRDRSRSPFNRFREVTDIWKATVETLKRQIVAKEATIEIRDQELAEKDAYHRGFKNEMLGQLATMYQSVLDLKQELKVKDKRIEELEQPRLDEVRSLVPSNLAYDALHLICKREEEPFTVDLRRENAALKASFRDFKYQIKEVQSKHDEALAELDLQTQAALAEKDRAIARLKSGLGLTVRDVFKSVMSTNPRQFSPEDAKFFDMDENLTDYLYQVVRSMCDLRRYMEYDNDKSFRCVMREEFPYSLLYIFPLNRLSFAPEEAPESEVDEESEEEESE
jgi:hypothetical protein